jgi:DNA-binding FadR family transcriptional regulator
VPAGLYADLGQVLRDSLREHFGGQLRPEAYIDHARLVDAILAGDTAAAAAEAGSHAAHGLALGRSGG